MAVREPRSALDRFVHLGGKILLLGCDHDNVTFLHYAGQIVDIPDKRVAKYRVPVADAGKRLWLVNTYLAHTNNGGGNVGDARAFLLDSHGLLEFGLRVMKAVAADPRAATTPP